MGVRLEVLLEPFEPFPIGVSAAHKDLGVCRGTVPTGDALAFCADVVHPAARVAPDGLVYSFQLGRQHVRSLAGTTCHAQSSNLTTGLYDLWLGFVWIVKFHS